MPAIRGTRLTMADSSPERANMLEHARPYRWRGIPGWNPAAVLGRERSKNRRQRECGQCGAQVGESCLTKDGKPMRSTHTGR